jgi:hypothetical protein
MLVAYYTKVHPLIWIYFFVADSSNIALTVPHTTKFVSYIRKENKIIMFDKENMLKKYA